jgi:hypothetical protein
VSPDPCGLATDRVTEAFIAAGGPFGPALAGALLIIPSRTATASRVALSVLGGALILSTAIWDGRLKAGWSGRHWD